MSLRSAPFAKPQGASRLRIRADGGVGFILEHERLLYAALAVIILIPIWAVERFPSVDGPVHVYTAFLIRTLIEGSAQGFSEVFRLNEFIEPNSTVYLLLVLADLVLSSNNAEKLVVTFYALFFAASARYAVKKISPENGYVAFLFIPFIMGYYIHWGFYNFSLGTVGFVLLIGYLVDKIDNLTPKQYFVICVSGFVLVLTHLFAFLMFLAAAGAMRLGVSIRIWTKSGDGRPRVLELQRLLLDGLRFAVALAPAIVIVVSFFVRHVATDNSTLEGLSHAKRFFYLASIAPIFSIDRRDAIALLPYIITVWGLAAYLAFAVVKGVFSPLKKMHLLTPVVFFGLLVLLGSIGMAHFDALPRVLPFFFFTLFFAIASVPMTQNRKALIVGLAAISSIASTAVHFGFYRQVNSLLAKYLERSGDPPAGSTMLNIHLAGKKDLVQGYSVGWRMDVTAHWSKVFAMNHGLVHLNTDLLSPSYFGYFPVAYRTPADSAVAVFGDSEAIRPRLAPYENASGVHIDFVEVWPARPPAPASQRLHADALKNMMPELSKNYRAEAQANPLSPLVFRRIDR